MERKYSPYELEKAYYPIIKPKFDYLCGLYGVYVNTDEKGKFIDFTISCNNDNEPGIEPNCDVRPHIESNCFPHSLIFQKRAYRDNPKTGDRFSVLATIEAPAINSLVKDVVSSEIKEETYHMSVDWHECPESENSKPRSISVTTRFTVGNNQSTKSIDLDILNQEGLKRYNISVFSLNIKPDFQTIMIRNKKTNQVSSYAKVDDLAFAEINAIINNELGMTDVYYYFEDILPVFQLISDYIDCDIKKINEETFKDLENKKFELKNRA